MIILVNLNFVENEEKFHLVLELFQKIGAEMKMLCLTTLTMSQSHLQKLIGQAPNLRYLELDKIEFLPVPDEESLETSKTLNNLKGFSFKGEQFPQILNQIVPDSLKTLFLDLGNRNIWKDVLGVFKKQKRLVDLYLLNIEIDEFEKDPETNKLTFLELNGVTFNHQAFESFVTFIKAQRNFEDVEFSVEKDEAKNSHNYNEAFKHILQQNTLKNFEALAGNILDLFNSLSTPNPYVKSMKLKNVPAQLDFSHISRCFPNISSLSLYCKEAFTDPLISLP